MDIFFIFTSAQCQQCSDWILRSWPGKQWCFYIFHHQLQQIHTANAHLQNLSWGVEMLLQIWFEFAMYEAMSELAREPGWLSAIIRRQNIRPKTVIAKSFYFWWSWKQDVSFYQTSPICVYSQTCKLLQMDLRTVHIYYLWTGQTRYAILLLIVMKYTSADRVLVASWS